MQSTPTAPRHPWRRAVAASLITCLSASAASSPDASTVTIRDDGVVQIDGRSFFPYGFYTDEKYDQEAMLAHARATGRAGFNVIHVEPIDNGALEPLFAEAHANGQYVIYGPWKGVGLANLRAVYDRVKHQPALLGYGIGDDVNDDGMQGYPANVADLKAIYDDARAHDPKHLCKVALGGSGAQVEVFSVRRFDAGAEEVYPINGGSPINLVYSSAVTSVANASRWKQSPWVALQTFDWRGTDQQRMPTVAEYTNMLYQALVAGAKGVLLYSYHVNDQGADSDPALWNGIAATVPEVQAISAFLTDGTLTRTVLGQGLYAGAWQHQGRTLVIVVHAGDYRSHLDPARNAPDPRAVSLPLPPGTSGTLRPAFAGRATGMAVVDGRLAGTIELLDVHAYLIGPDPVAPVITSHPSDALVRVGAVASFQVVATGDPAPTYHWQSAPPGSATFASIDGAAGASYTTGAATTVMAGTRYRCIVRNDAGEAISEPATLRVDAAADTPTVDRPARPDQGGGSSGCGLGSGFTLLALGIAACLGGALRRRNPDHG